MMTVNVQQNLSNRKIGKGYNCLYFLGGGVLSSLYRERRSTVVLGDSPRIAEANRYPCRMDILTLFTTNTSIL